VLELYIVPARFEIYTINTPPQKKEGGKGRNAYIYFIPQHLDFHVRLEQCTHKINFALAGSKGRFYNVYFLEYTVAYSHDSLNAVETQ